MKKDEFEALESLQDILNSCAHKLQRGHHIEAAYEMGKAHYCIEMIIADVKVEDDESNEED
jgi:hypothetical protein